MTPLELLPMLLDAVALAAPDPAHTADAAHAVTDAGPEPGEMFIGLSLVVVAGLFSVSLGMLLCLVRIWRGPTLADRVLASDVFALHVVALVVLLTIYLGDLTFFDAVLGVAIIGFASTVGFAQYIAAPAPGPGNDHATAGDPRSTAAPAEASS